MKSKLNNLISNGNFKEVKSLSKNSFANIFNVVNKGDKSYFNLSKDLDFNYDDFLDNTLFSVYIAQEGDLWTMISYKFYNTIELWWLICKFNKVKNPTEAIVPGTRIRIPSDDVKDLVIETISNI